MFSSRKVQDGLTASPFQSPLHISPRHPFRGSNGKIQRNRGDWQGQRPPQMLEEMADREMTGKCHWKWKEPSDGGAKEERAAHVKTGKRSWDGRRCSRDRGKAGKRGQIRKNGTRKKRAEWEDFSFGIMHHICTPTPILKSSATYALF